MRLLSAAGLPVSWPWRVVAAVGIVLVIGLAIYVPQILLLFSIVALALLLSDWVRTRAAIAELAAQIAAGKLSSKLEVRTGVWGALCHAVNGMLQQQRLQQRIRTLLPEPSQQTLDQLLQATHENHETTAMATVLLVGCTGVGSMPLSCWQMLAGVARAQAESQGALMQGCGGMMLLVFGVFKQQGRATGLRAALETAQALQTAWDAETGTDLAGLKVTIASGSVVTGVLPGLGYSVLGTPVEQAISLQQLATTQPAFALLCAEETYVALRSLQQDLLRATGASELPGERAETWVQTDMRLHQSDRSPQVVYGRYG